MPAARFAAAAALLCLLPGAPARGQQAAVSQGAPRPPAAVAALRSTAFLLGDWEGDGWIVLGPGQRRTFHQHESVRPAAGGTVVVIDGVGTSTDAGREGELVHQAFAVVSYDSATAALRWRAFRATGEETVAQPEVSAASLAWGMPVGPGGRAGSIRFAISLTPLGQWHEEGQFFPPGAPAGAGVKFFEMTLNRRP